MAVRIYTIDRNALHGIVHAFISAKGDGKLDHVVFGERAPVQYDPAAGAVVVPARQEVIDTMECIVLDCSDCTVV